jgi:hypothetical protein
MDHFGELGFIANLAPAGMISVLFAAARVAARGLQVTVFNGTDPDVGPRGRNREPADAEDSHFVSEGLAGGVNVSKTVAALFAANAWTIIR